MAKLTAKELKLADTVRLTCVGGYNTATVKNVTAEHVTLFRPYVETADFSYTGGVICYIGIEEFSIPRNDSFEYEVIDRKPLP